MHKTISLKHRIVRRVDIDKAPLATFDTVDLGDEDDVDIRPSSSNFQQDSSKTATSSEKSDIGPRPLEADQSGVFVTDDGKKSGTIGGNNSKKSLSQAGREEKESKADRTKDRPAGSDLKNVPEADEGEGPETEPQPLDANKSEFVPSETATPKTEAASSDKDKNGDKGVRRTTAVPALTHQGSIGRVNIPIKKQDSGSSSSSPGSCSETTFTFQSSRPTIVHLNGAGPEEYSHDAKKEGFDSLIPEYTDPSQILSPSKRKAFEKRIERLKVSTSPIARPRSTAPINVVTLDEYATISSPEPSPAAPYVTQDKLRITLPSDEFALKPKTPKLHSAKRQNSEDTCFEFTEEILFSRTKAALVVHEDGQLPLSPRRVLIPPNLTPTTSPKLSTSPRLSPDITIHHQEVAAAATDIPKLVFSQQSETAHKYFGATVDESDDENWANFPDFSEADDKSEHDTSSSTVCDAEERQSQGFTLTDQNLEVASETSTSERILPSLQTISFQPINTQQSGELDLGCELHTGINIVSSEEDKRGINSQVISGDWNFDTSTDHKLVSPFTGRSSSDTSCSVKQSELLCQEFDPNFESEEIVTIHINESPAGLEKEIEIEIKPKEASGSISPIYEIKPRIGSGTISPIYSDRSKTQLTPDSESISVISDETLIHQRLLSSVAQSTIGADSVSEELCNLGSGSFSSATSFHDSQQNPTTDSYHVKIDHLVHHVQPPQPQFPLSFGSHTLIPQAFDFHSLIDSSVSHHEPPQLEPHWPQPQALDDRPGLRQRPPSTNPFDINFVPPQPETFDSQIVRSNTNPFLEDPQPVTSNLLDFSSLYDDTSS